VHQVTRYGVSLQAFVCGRAASGLSCILVRVITKATLPDSPAGLRQSTLIFLSIASLIVMGCVVVATWLPAHAPGEGLLHVLNLMRMQCETVVAGTSDA
jgi:hypothetical protein